MAVEQSTYTNKSSRDKNLRNSYTIPIPIPRRAEWDLLPEPESEGNKSREAQGDVV